MKITAAKRKQFAELEELLEREFGDYSSIGYTVDLVAEDEDDLWAVATVTFEKYSGDHVVNIEFSLVGDTTQINLYEDCYEDLDVYASILWKYIAFDSIFEGL